MLLLLLRRGKCVQNASHSSEFDNTPKACACVQISEEKGSPVRKKNASSADAFSRAWIRCNQSDAERMVSMVGPEVERKVSITLNETHSLKIPTHTYLCIYLRLFKKDQSDTTFRMFSIQLFSFRTCQIMKLEVWEGEY